MAFQVKDFVSITASMLNWMKATTHKISDFTVGSVSRTLVEGPAAEMDELYQQMFIGIREAIPVATYTSFSFDKIPAVSATGLIRVVIQPGAADVTIAAGTTFSAAGLTSSYSALQDTVIPAGSSYADVSVKADTVGTAGNIDANQAFTMTPMPSSFVSATNLSAFTTGSDEETDEERKLRFNAYIDSISRATGGSIVYGAKTTALTDSLGNITERVTSAAIVEPYKTDPNKPIAYVELYIHNGMGKVSSALVNACQTIIDGYRKADGTKVDGYKGAGIPVKVIAAGEVLINVSGVITPESGYDKADLITLATDTVYAYIQGLDIGDECLATQIIHLVKGIEGVYNFTLTTPAADTTAGASQKLMPGAIAFT